MRKIWKAIQRTIRYWVVEILSVRCESCPCIESSIADDQTGSYDCWCGIFKDEEAVCLLPMFVRRAYAKRREREEIERAAHMAEYYRELREEAEAND